MTAGKQMPVLEAASTVGMLKSLHPQQAKMLKALMLKALNEGATIASRGVAVEDRMPFLNLTRHNKEQPKGNVAGCMRKR